MLTFDDGYACLDEVCRGILAKQGVKPIIFINSDCIEENDILASVIAQKYDKKYSSEEPWLKITPKTYINQVQNLSIKQKSLLRQHQGNMLSTAVLKKLVEEEFLIVGNHLSNHWNCSNQSIADIQSSYERCEQYIIDIQGFSYKIFAYPNGQPNKCFKTTVR